MCFMKLCRYVLAASVMLWQMSCSRPHRKPEDDPVALDMVKDASSLGVQRSRDGKSDGDSELTEPDEPAEKREEPWVKLVDDVMVYFDTSSLAYGVNDTIRSDPLFYRVRIRSQGLAEEIDRKRINPREVYLVVKAHSNESRYCYIKGFMNNERLEGTARVLFFIGSKGRVKRCRVLRNLSDPKVGECLCKRLYTWHFPQAKGGPARVVYEWTFSPAF